MVKRPFWPIEGSNSGCQPALLPPRPIVPGGAATEMFIQIRDVANILIVAGLVVYGFNLLAEYFARGRWAKNVTGFLAGLGMLALAVALILTPENAEVITRIARTRASTVLVWISSGLLLAAIAAFGIITYSKPLRLWHERRIERDLHRELPKIP